MLLHNNEWVHWLSIVLLLILRQEFYGLMRKTWLLVVKVGLLVKILKSRLAFALCDEHCSYIVVIFWKSFNHYLKIFNTAFEKQWRTVCMLELLLDVVSCCFVLLMRHIMTNKCKNKRCTMYLSSLDVFWFFSLCWIIMTCTENALVLFCVSFDFLHRECRHLSELWNDLIFN